jgi:hypothetical protein
MIPAPEKVTKPIPGSDAADKKTLKIIENYGLVSVVVGSRTVGNFVRPLDLPKARFKSRNGLTPKPSNDNRLPCWDDTGQRLKFGMAMQSLSDRGYAFTFNFGPNRLAELLTHPKGFARALALYMNRALDARLDCRPDYGFVIEMTARGKLHVHGGIECGPAELSVVKEALVHAAGKGWVKTRPGETQVKFGELFYPTGWTRYSFEDNPKARRVIKGNTVVITNPLRNFGELLYGAVRKTINRR